MSSTARALAAISQPKASRTVTSGGRGVVDNLLDRLRESRDHSIIDKAMAAPAHERDAESSTVCASVSRYCCEHGAVYAGPVDTFRHRRDQRERRSRLGT